MSTTTLRDTGDKQLWAFTVGEISLPVFIQPFEDPQSGHKVKLVWPAIDLDATAYEYFYSTIDRFAVCRSEQYFIFDANDDMTEWFTKCDGVTPTRYLKWSAKTQEEVRDQIAADLAAYNFGDSSDDQFLLAVIRRTQMLNLPQMKVLWNAINHVALKWMCIDKRPISFAFGTIAPLPYRVNWKSVLLFGFRHSFSCFYKKSVSEKPCVARVDHLDAMKNYGLLDGFFGRELMEVKGKARKHHLGEHTVGWSLEIIESRKFTELVDQVELNRLRKVGKVAYANSIGPFIARARHYVVAAYRQYVLRSAQPFCRLAKNNFSSGYFIVPHTAKGGIDYKVAVSTAGHIQCDTGNPFSNTAFRTLSTGAAWTMRPVRPIRPKEVDVRNGGEHVDEPEDEGK